MIHWGILGTGKIANRFAASLAAVPECELTAVGSRDRGRAERFVEAHPARAVYTEYDSVLKNEDIDAVYLALPHTLHREWAVRALRAGKAVLCEKPGALNAAEMRDIAETAMETGCLFMEAMKTCFVPLFQRIRELVSEGVIGKIIRVETSLCNQMIFDANHPTYHTDPGQGGALLDVGIYCAAWLREFLDGSPSLVKLAADIRSDLDYYVDAELEYPNGQTAEIECAFDRAKPRNAVIYGTLGRIEVRELHRPQELTLFVDGQLPKTIQCPYLVDDFYGEIRHFAECLQHGKTESDVMPLSASVQCAGILDTIRAGFAYTPKCMEVLQKQEDILQFDEFGNREALKLGNTVAQIALEYDRGISVEIIRESDGMTLFHYAMDDKSPGNAGFMEGKRKTALSCGHCSLWAYVEHECTGAWQELFDQSPPYIPSGGAFPVRVRGEWIATMIISGLHEGKDHELAVRALSQMLNRHIPVFPGVAV